ASGDTTDDSTPTLRGRGVAGSVIYFQSGTWDGAWENAGSTVVKADGSWEWTSPALSHNTTWEFRALARLDGAESEWSGKFVLEYNNPAPTITDAFDDFGAETGSLASGDTTDDNTPTLRGTAPADSVVMIRAQHASGETTYSVKADADGKWSWTPDKGLAKGDWDFQVKNSAMDNWGDTFKLNVSQGYPEGAGILNFEELPLGSIKDGKKFAFFNQLSFNFYRASGFGIPDRSEIGKIVKTPDEAPDNFGKQSLIFYKPWMLEIGRSDINNGIKGAGATIWNNGTEDAEFVLLYGSTIEVDRILVKAGESYFFNLSDYGLDNVDRVVIKTIKFSENIYIDNIYGTLQKMNVLNDTEDGVNSILHNLDGVDALTDHPITGSETQVDTLQLTGKDQLLDLSQHQAEIQSVEIFDIRGSGDNTLKIDLDALLHYGEKDLFIEDGKTQLMVNGDAGDVVQLKDILPEGSDISEWQHQQGTVTVAGVEYEVYSHGDDAELLVQQGVKTELI
uniref:Ig-like domain-containing protein n=1 Tax=Pantoea endophytica TaxID=92488 RepID=UPI001FD8269F